LRFFLSMNPSITTLSGGCSIFASVETERDKWSGSSLGPLAHPNHPAMALNRPLHNLITTTGNPATRSSSSLVTPQLQAYADPQFTPTVDPTLLNYLVHEAGPFLRPV
jgi:hypothetical protein